MEDISAIVFINLDRRKDRLEEITTELNRMRIEGAIRFPAIEHQRGAVGCMLSHLEILKMAKVNGWHNVLILEDDFMFIVDSATFRETLKSFFNSKITYDVLMLSYNLHVSEELNDKVGYARKVYTSAGYIVHNRMYDDLIVSFEKNAPRLEAEPHNHGLYALDACWHILQTTREWLYLKTRIGIQRPGYSDIERRNVSYGV